jgi:hypothetical protein
MSKKSQNSQKPRESLENRIKNAKIRIELMELRHQVAEKRKLLKSK